MEKSIPVSVSLPFRLGEAYPDAFFPFPDADHPRLSRIEATMSTTGRVRVRWCAADTFSAHSEDVSLEKPSSEFGFET